MKNGICPKCGSSEVYAGTGLTNKAGYAGINSIPVTYWIYAALNNYVCAGCGYVESYINDASKLEKIKQKWPRVKKI